MIVAPAADDFNERALSGFLAHVPLVKVPCSLVKWSGVSGVSEWRRKKVAKGADSQNIQQRQAELTALKKLAYSSLILLAFAIVAAKTLGQSRQQVLALLLAGRTLPVWAGERALSLQKKLVLFASLDRENEALRLENGQLHLRLQDQLFSSEAQVAATWTEKRAKENLGQTGTRVGRTLEDIAYQPPSNLNTRQLYALGLSFFMNRQDEKAGVILHALAKEALAQPATAAASLSPSPKPAHANAAVGKINEALKGDDTFKEGFSEASFAIQLPKPAQDQGEGGSGAQLPPSDLGAVLDHSEMLRLFLMTGIAWYRLDHLKRADEYFSRIINTPQLSTKEAILDQMNLNDLMISFQRIQAQARLWRAVIAQQEQQSEAAQAWMDEVMNHHPHSQEAKWINRGAGA